MPTSPLTEPDPKSMDEEMRRLDEVMSGDPRTLTRANRDQAVAYYRSLRAQWEKDAAAGKTRARAPKLPSGTPLNLEDALKELKL
jgi:hypothetical protein